jgi:hypothetical protein
MCALQTANKMAISVECEGGKLLSGRRELKHDKVRFSQSDHVRSTRRQGNDSFRDGNQQVQDRDRDLLKHSTTSRLPQLTPAHKRCLSPRT